MVPDVVPTPIEEHPTAGEVPAVVSAVPSGRRKFLTRGVAGGSVAALVAGKPVKTLAKAYCKYSGWNSVKVKKKKGKKGKGKGVTLSHAPKTCSIKVPPPTNYFKKKSKSHGTIVYGAVNWPTHSFNGHSITTGTYFSTLFGSDNVGGMGSYELLKILSTWPTCVESYMIAVAFASTNSGFPLSQSYVYDLWHNYAQNSTEAAALLEFLQQLA